MGCHGDFQPEISPWDHGTTDCWFEQHLQPVKATKNGRNFDMWHVIHEQKVALFERNYFGKHLVSHIGEGWHEDSAEDAMLSVATQALRPRIIGIMKLWQLDPRNHYDSWHVGLSETRLCLPLMLPQLGAQYQDRSIYSLILIWFDFK